jgi:hypothetical protein
MQEEHQRMMATYQQEIEAITRQKQQASSQVAFS